MAIQEGTQAPDFTLSDARGAEHSLSEYRGKPVIVYFYPKDDTPGCTKEACGFRDLHKEFRNKEAVILGISPDAADSHEDFAGKYGLPFTLLSDPDHRVMDTYGAWGEKKRYGKVSIGVIRSTVLVGPDGKVVKHWKRVPDAEKHPAKVLEALETL